MYSKRAWDCCAFYQTGLLSLKKKLCLLERVSKGLHLMRVVGAVVADLGVPLDRKAGLQETSEVRFAR